ncbi:MAG: DUF11 domain-containing protein, partial [Candidatus Kerfeldbacteria bacterium]|nr:DUF11 domain-containing protein [Candidatus Kerfeldbacteria bacterium]
SCGLDIALVVDSSGSIEEDELFLMQNAFEGFVDAFLPGTPSLMSVTDFDTVATLEQPFTDNAAAVKAAVNGTASGGFTNWDDALAKASSSFDPRPTKPNLLLFASDGNPNKRGHPATPAGNATDADAALAAALTRAETIKASGTRILALGIGDGLNLGNLMAIAGPAVNTGVTSDVITSSYFSLAEDLAELAASLCSGKLIIEKQLDLDGDGVPEVDGSVATPLLAGWEFQVEAADADDETVVTDQTGVIELDADAGVFSITETAGDFREDVQLLDITCLKGSQSVGAVNLASRQVTGLTLDGDDVITCTFLNGLPTFDLHGYKWHDANGNASNDCGEAVGDAQSCEPFLAGWTIFLDANGNQVLDAGEQSTITSSEPEHFGWYWFMNLPAGTYSICEAPQVGWAQTYPQGETDCHTVTLPFDAGPSTCVESSQVNAVASEQSCNFANRTVPTGTVTFEKVILGPGNPVEWSFAYQNQTFGHGQTVELNAGSGSLTESGPSGYTLVDATGACTLNGGAATLTVVEGPSTCTLINERDLGTVSGVKFNDANANGVRDAGEAGVGGVTINLSTGPSTVTAADGSYAFPGLPTGAYTVSEVVPAGWLSTTPTSVAVTVSKGGTATANFGNRQPPTLGLTKTPSVATAAPSQDVRYTIGWSVVGNSVATNVAIVDPVPTGTTFVSIEDGGTYDAATNALTWKLGTQNPGASGIVHATLKMNSALGDGSKVVNSATIDSLETDPPFAAHATVTIVTPQVLAATAQPTLTLAKVAGQTSVNAGATLQYTVTISNIGEADAVGVTLTDSLPDGFTFTDTGEQNRVLALGVLAVGATKTITYEVTVDPETNAGRYVNTATVTADNHDGLVARASVDVRTPSVLGAVTELADTGAGSQDYVLFTIGLALLLIGRIGYGRAHRGTLDT